MKKHPLTLLLAVVCGIANLLIPARSEAAPVTPASITWGSATNISGDTDVSTLGTRVAAFNLGNIAGAQPATVNGVPFDPFVITGNPTTVGNFTLFESPGSLVGNNNFGWPTPPYATLSPMYQTLLGSAANGNIPVTLTLTMSALSIGQDYQFEWWTNDSSAPNYTTTATAGSSVSLSDNTTNVLGGIGQFAIGTFTASATSHSIAFSGITGFPTINAFELRAIPEPSTLVLGLAGLAGLSLFGLRKRFRPA